MNRIKKAVALYARITPLIDAAILAGDSVRYELLSNASTRAHNMIMRCAKVGV